ncbi:hypothetical protein P8A18_10720 [Streptomyces castrisilvae]|uniref:Uncharacterized protein n=1 Tax=Streptomyces castrisilvae TaxID=3033811 RepID=A0ABY9HH80_9ACTN|nr:hypothetical protein [Streptomyces sp. Mut1]WLQ33892.1 hypothetical protein P8A18_10720 [Streptomyces sp. Mut1]
MARDYDSQLLESVGVRRRRMRDALLFGAGRARRTADERLGKVFAGIAVTAVLCAGCGVTLSLFDSMQQLEHSGADFRTFMVDTKGSVNLIRTPSKTSPIKSRHH